MQTIVIKLDGQEHRLAAGDITALDAKAFRAVVGRPLMTAFDGDVDLDVIAGVVWISRRRTEPGLTYEQVAGGISYASDLDVDIGADVALGAADPET
jgi:hypothetical protein